MSVKRCFHKMSAESRMQTDQVTRLLEHPALPMLSRLSCPGNKSLQTQPAPSTLQQASQPSTKGEGVLDRKSVV